MIEAQLALLQFQNVVSMWHSALQSLQSGSKRQEKDENIGLLAFASLSLLAKIIIEFDGGQVVFFTLQLNSFGRRENWLESADPLSLLHDGLRVGQVLRRPLRCMMMPRRDKRRVRPVVTLAGIGRRTRVSVCGRKEKQEEGRSAGTRWEMPLGWR